MDFVIGQRVRAIGLVDGLEVPTFGTVKGFEDNDPESWMAVEFDAEFDEAWDCHGVCDERRGRFGPQDEFTVAIMENV